MSHRDQGLRLCPSLPRLCPCQVRLVKAQLASLRGVDGLDRRNAAAAAAATSSPGAAPAVSAPPRPLGSPRSRDGAAASAADLLGPGGAPFPGRQAAGRPPWSSSAAPPPPGLSRTPPGGGAPRWSPGASPAAAAAAAWEARVGALFGPSPVLADAGGLGGHRDFHPALRGAPRYAHPPASPYAAGAGAFSATPGSPPRERLPFYGGSPTAWQAPQPARFGSGGGGSGGGWQARGGLYSPARSTAAAVFDTFGEGRPYGSTAGLGLYSTAGGGLAYRSPPRAGGYH